MAKNIIKEVIIILLLCFAIILVMGILLYDYLPNSKTIPEEVAYVTPEKIKQELLKSSDVDDSQIILTYEIDSTDLNNYKKIKDYKEGKANPFSSYDTTASTSGENNANTATQSGNTNNTNTVGNSTTNNTVNTTSNSSSGSYFQDKGTK